MPDPQQEKPSETERNSFWSKRTREGVAQLESLWRDVQRYQGVSLKRAKSGATELQKNVAQTLTQAGEKLSEIATEARSKSHAWAEKAQSLISRVRRDAASKTDTHQPPHEDQTK